MALVAPKAVHRGPRGRALVSPYPHGQLALAFREFFWLDVSYVNDCTQQGIELVENTAVLAIVMATLGQVFLSVSLLLPRAIHTQAYWPLVAFFMLSGVMAAVPAVAAFLPAWQTHAIAMMAPAFLLQAPALWLYIQGLTSPTPWHLKRKQAWHLWPAGLGALTAILILSLPPATRYALFLSDQDVNTPLANITAFCVLLCLLLWLAQSGFYLFKIIKRLGAYRRQLKDLFASNEQRELGWLSFLLIIVASIWGVSLLIITFGVMQKDLGISNTLLVSLYFVLVWSLAAWGLRQKPGFDGRYQSIAPPIPKQKLTKPQPSTAKYQRSALGAEQEERIALKIQNAMQEQQLFLDPALSLQKLAQHLAITPHYVSQALNNTLQQSFFDYVNQCRVIHAKPLIKKGDMTVIDITYAAGFNARSSFYKAFKKETGQTPSEFRAASA